jgi:hypothetical protein
MARKMRRRRKNNIFTNNFCHFKFQNSNLGERMLLKCKLRQPNFTAKDFKNLHINIYIYIDTHTKLQNSQAWNIKINRVISFNTWFAYNRVQFNNKRRRKIIKLQSLP